MKIKNIAIISLIILIISVGIVSATDNVTQDTLSKNITEDTLQATPVSGDSFNDIQKAVDSSKKGGVIELEGYYSSSHNPITIKKDITIQGSSKGATLDGKKMSTVFYITSSVVLKNLVIKNAIDKSEAVQLFDGKDLTIINCTFINNYQGVYGWGNSLKIINSTFKNHASSAVFAVCDLTVSDCVFENNGGKNTLGGAIYSVSDNVDISNSRFINNKASNGGAVYKQYDNLTIKNCLFDKNYAYECGGSVYFSNYLYEDDIITGNVKISSSNFTNSKSAKKGGVIYTNFANVNIDTTKVEPENVADQIYICIGNCNISGADYTHINKIKATLKADKMKTTYDSRKYFFVQFNDENGSPITDRSIQIKIFTGKNSKDYICFTFEDDYWETGAYLSIKKSIGVGKHKVEITSLSKYYDVKKITTYITVSKAKTVVKAPTVKAKYKKSKKFKITVKNKASGFKVPNVKLKVKVYTGKKYQTFKLTTNKKGVASFNVKKLKRGTHKVKITSKDKNYIISKKSKIIIR